MPTPKPTRRTTPKSTRPPATRRTAAHLPKELTRPTEANRLTHQAAPRAYNPGFKRR